MIKITIRTDNAAFEDNKGAEVARILRELADEYEQIGVPERGQAIPLADINGNAVGEATGK